MWVAYTAIPTNQKQHSFRLTSKDHSTTGRMDHSAKEVTEMHLHLYTFNCDMGFNLGCSRYWPWTWWNKGIPRTSWWRTNDKQHGLSWQIDSARGRHLDRPSVTPPFSPRLTWRHSRVQPVDINKMCSHDIHKTNLCWRRSPKYYAPTPHWLPTRTSLYNIQQIKLQGQNNNRIQKSSLLTQVQNVANDSNHMQKLYHNICTSLQQLWLEHIMTKFGANFIFSTVLY
jgi:hypothetical protein